MAFLIRQATAADAPAIAAIYRIYVLQTPITFEETPPTAADFSIRISETLPRYPYLVAEDAGNVIGYSYAGPHGARASYRWSVNVAIYLSQSHHRRGIGSLLYRQLFQLLRQQGFAMAYAGVTLPNSASVGLHESLGFRSVALYKSVGYKFGQWRDVGWWELPLLDPLPSVPAEPTAWASMPPFVAVHLEGKSCR